VGDFAAGSEMAFCTLLQRSYAVLGARMHYGHPDLMNKQHLGIPWAPGSGQEMVKFGEFGWNFYESWC
jgi:hypothetical protein